MLTNFLYFEIWKNSLYFRNQHRKLRLLVCITPLNSQKNFERILHILLPNRSERESDSGRGPAGGGWGGAAWRLAGDLVGRVGDI